MFGKKPQRPAAVAAYDKTGKTPMMKASICNGEKVLGFKDQATGRFEEIMFVRDDRDLEEFMRTYDVKEEEIKKVW